MEIGEKSEFLRVLAEIDQTTKKILDLMPKPPSKVMRALSAVGTASGAVGLAGILVQILSLMGIGG
jgi:hypothetical protein